MSGKPTRMDRIKAATTLEGLYAVVPKPIDCTGECWDSCGPIGYSEEEGRRMNEIGQRPPNSHERRHRLMCSALTKEHLCSVYEARPMICRLWGVSERMPCPHGPKDNPCWTAFPLDEAETSLLMNRAMEIGGHPPEMRQHYQMQYADLIDIIQRTPRSWDGS